MMAQLFESREYEYVDLNYTSIDESLESKLDDIITVAHDIDTKIKNADYYNCSLPMTSKKNTTLKPHNFSEQVNRPLPVLPSQTSLSPKKKLNLSFSPSPAPPPPPPSLKKDHPIRNLQPAPKPKEVKLNVKDFRDLNLSVSQCEELLSEIVEVKKFLDQALDDEYDDKHINMDKLDGVIKMFNRNLKQKKKTNV